MPIFSARLEAKRRPPLATCAVCIAVCWCPHVTAPNTSCGSAAIGRAVPESHGALRPSHVSVPSYRPPQTRGCPSLGSRAAPVRVRGRTREPCGTVAPQRGAGASVQANAPGQGQAPRCSAACRAAVEAAWPSTVSRLDPLVTQCGRRRAHAAPFPVEAWRHSAHRIPCSPVRDRPGPWLSQDGAGLPWARGFLPSGPGWRAGRMVAQAEHRRLGAGPRQGRMAALRARGAGALPRRGLGPCDHAARRDAILHAREAGDGMELVEEDQAPARAPPRDGWPPVAGWASWCGAVWTRVNATAWSRGASWRSSARSTARLCGPAGAANRAATPSRVAVEASFVPRSGRLYGRGVCWLGGSRSARVRLRGIRRRSRSRGARIFAGETEACGSIPPRRRTALCWAAIVSLCASPPWIACIDRAGPSTQGMPSRAQRSASPSQVKRHATQTTRSAREGAMVLRNRSGPAGICRWTRLSPWWSRRQTSMVRACRSMPPYKGCWLVEKRLRSPPLLRDCFLLLASHCGMRRRGPQ